MNGYVTIVPIKRINSKKYVYMMPTKILALSHQYLV